MQTKKRKTGLAAACTFSPEMQHFLEVDEEARMSRPEVVKARLLELRPATNLLLTTQCIESHTSGRSHTLDLSQEYWNVSTRHDLALLLRLHVFSTYLVHLSADAGNMGICQSQ